jgi:Calcineurin-like phosphoesterase
MQKRLGPIVVLLLMLLAVAFGKNLLFGDRHEEYSFLVAGHVYGSHNGDNVGVYPKFLNILPPSIIETDQFLVLNGDIVRHSKKESWQQVERDLRPLEMPIYYVMGNHDLSKYSKNLFREKYNNTYYGFESGGDQFIILDSQLHRGSIQGEQLAFLQEQLDQNPASKNVFIFFHELIWTARNSKYKNVKHNYGSYDKLYESNYWLEVHPLLLQYPEKEFFIVAGDVGGNPKVIPAFYEKLDNVTLLASGMGQIQDENFLRITVRDQDVHFTLIPLNPQNTLSPLEEYGLD